MIPTIQNPIFKCSLCGKEEEQTDTVSTGIPDYWACRECRAKMKKLSITQVIYEDGYMEVIGNCDFCKQYPCRHGDTIGIVGISIVSSLPIEGRKRWLGTLMMFPPAKTVTGIKLVQARPNTPLHSIGAEIEVYWPLGEGGRPAEVYNEIEAILKTYGCTLATYKTDSDYHLGWVHRIGDSAPTEKRVKAMLRRDGDGIERMPDNLIYWDWKESRLEMIKDLNEAMQALKIPLKWKLGEEVEGNHVQT